MAFALVWDCRKNLLIFLICNVLSVANACFVLSRMGYFRTLKDPDY